MSCLFCNDLSEIKEINKDMKRKSTFVAVLREDIKKGGNVSYGSYKLNYCPECGKEIKKMQNEL